MLDKLKSRARLLKIETTAIYLAARDPRTPWYAKVIAMGTVAYALSPLDLIPDFVPVLGYLDDLFIVPGGIALALKLIPPRVMEEAREKARQDAGPGRGVKTAGTILIALIGILFIIGFASIILHFVR
jgi:uncharacterized membrane protein YkvA (DUF1232 family)